MKCRPKKSKLDTRGIRAGAPAERLFLIFNILQQSSANIHADSCGFGMAVGWPLVSPFPFVFLPTGREVSVDLKTRKRCPENVQIEPSQIEETECWRTGRLPRNSGQRNEKAQEISRPSSDNRTGLNAAS